MNQDNASKIGNELFASPVAGEEDNDNRCSTPTVKKFPETWKFEELNHHVFVPESMKKRSKSRANKRLSRHNSLKESKVSL